MRDVNIHGKKDFAAGKMAVRGIVGSAQLRVGEIRDYASAVLEGIAEELHNGIFFRGRWQSVWLRVLQASAELIVRGGNMGHQLAEVHTFGVRAESVLIRRHCLCDGHRELAERAKVLGILACGV